MEVNCMKSKIYNYSKEELQHLLDSSNGYGDVLSKIGLGRKGRNPDKLKIIIKEYDLDETKMNKNRSEFYKKCAIQTHLKTTKPLSEILVKNSTFTHASYLLKKLVKAGLKEYKCEICGITEWTGKPIVLQVHHKDGDNKNNELENIEIVCPNCHSQTDTYAGKNNCKEKL